MKWLYKVQREFPAHVVFVVKDAYLNGMEKNIGWGDREFLYVIRDGLFLSYRTKENDREMYEFFKDKVKERKFLEKIKAKTEEAERAYKTETEKISNECKKDLSWKNLLELYEKAYNAEYCILSIMNFSLYFEQAGPVPEEAKQILKSFFLQERRMQSQL